MLFSRAICRLMDRMGCLFCGALEIDFLFSCTELDNWWSCGQLFTESILKPLLIKLQPDVREIPHQSKVHLHVKSIGHCSMFMRGRPLLSKNWTQFRKMCSFPEYTKSLLRFTWWYQTHVRKRCNKRVLFLGFDLNLFMKKTKWILWQKNMFRNFSRNREKVSEMHL